MILTSVCLRSKVCGLSCLQLTLKSGKRKRGLATKEPRTPQEPGGLSATSRPLATARNDLASCAGSVPHRLSPTATTGPSLASTSVPRPRDAGGHADYPSAADAQGSAAGPAAKDRRGSRRPSRREGSSC